VHALVGASSVDSVVRVTGNFASESPLHPAAREALLAAFDQGWADPKKLSQSSSRAAILRNQALENIAASLGIPVDSIEVIGEPSLGHLLSIEGLASPTSQFAYSDIDKGKIRAIARARSEQAISLNVNRDGAIQNLSALPENTVLSYQLANGETGVIQNSLPDLAPSIRVAVDATASGPRLPLPSQWHTALFDSQSWNGPSGIGIMAIRDRSQFAYPLPRIAPIYSPGSYSLPLLIAASIALEKFAVEDARLREFAINNFSQLDGVEIVAPTSTALPHLFSISVKGISGERAVRELAAVGVDIDSGSACSPEDLQPSHVLAAMGYETAGHLRFTLHQGTTEGDISDLISKVAEVIQTLRR
jgi:cysteine desulfurase